MTGSKALLVIIATAATAFFATPSLGERPKKVRLVLQITVDQLRGDLPGRVLDRLEPGGLRYLF